MTKVGLISEISKKSVLTESQSETLVLSILEMLSKTLEQGNRIEIRGFGTFEVREYSGYEGRNPKSGEPIHISDKRLPHFKVGKDLRISMSQSKVGNK